VKNLRNFPVSCFFLRDEASRNDKLRTVQLCELFLCKMSINANSSSLEVVNFAVLQNE
jgi:hypothetical protein